MENYKVMYWYGPKEITKQNASQIKNAGFNLIPVFGRDSADIISQAKLCAAEGVNVMVQDDRIFKAIRGKDEREKLLAEVVSDYSGVESIISYYITDEPSCVDYADLKSVCDILNRLDPARETYINLFPNYASDEQLGCSGYAEHIKRYIAEVAPKIISYDHYHFVGRFDKPQPKAESTDDREKLIIEAAWNTSSRAGFFDNIELIREESQRNGIPFMVIILLVEHGPYRNLTEAELRWEVYQSLAYGSCRISYFTYMTVDSDDGWKWANGMQNLDGTLARHYYDVKKINAELPVAGKIVNSHKSLAVRHIGTEPDRSIKYFDQAAPAKAAVKEIKTTCPLTLGYFEDGYILLANKDFIKINKVDITLAEGKRIQVTDKLTGGVYMLNSVTDQEHTYTLTLMPGDGEFIRIC